MRIHWLLLFLFFRVFSQEPPLPKGVITDSVPIAGSGGETFAVYIPNDYNSGKPAPVVFVFDPAARGKIGIAPLVPAAEKYQFLLIGANNIRNGPYTPNFKAAERLFAYSLKTFQILPDRIYTAGFSGGARLAATIAILSGAIEGVIGCGAGFAGFPYLPSSSDHFSYAGIVGDRDMNYQEMMALPDWLSTTGIASEIFTFDGDHQWPPPDALLSAFDWLQLQAIKKGLVPKDDSGIHDAYADNYQRARSLEEKGMYYASVLEYERILRNYPNYINLDSLRNRVALLRKSKAYRKEATERLRVRQLEDTLSSRYQRRFYEELELPQKERQFKWWQRQLNRLDKDYVQSHQSYLKKMGGRLRYQLFAMALESFEAQVSDHHPDKAVYCSRLLILQDPENPFIHYKLARGFARLELMELASDHLLRSLECGWTNRDALEQAQELRFLLEAEPIKSLVEQL